jgi:hypothetical protein
MVGGAYGVKRAPASKDPMTGPGGIICNRKKCFNYKVANDWQVLRQKLTSLLSAECDYLIKATIFLFVNNFFADLRKLVKLKS